jgi:putative transposase
MTTENKNKTVTGALAEGQRWSAGRKREVVLRMLRGESVDALSRELNVEIYRLEQWRETPSDPSRTQPGHAPDRRADHGKRASLGTSEEARPFNQAEVVEMSQTISPGADKPYGIHRVCRIWEQARSSYYHAIHQCGANDQEPPRRRGPRPLISDEALLELIRADLASSPFAGEGHRKVWARLRIRDGIRVSRKRVLRLMRENHLLSPYRNRPKPAKKHDGKIITMAPNLMWGTDGTRVFTLEEGWVWIFAAVEHWNAECVGWHVCKKGDRYAALQPISMALNDLYGGVQADIARGLTLRMDHGTQYLSDHFLNQLKYWGITPSFAFISEPETNGVAERFNRTLKEQAIYGRVFRTVEDVRQAVKNFVELYNSEWRPEKNAFRSPREIRQNWLENHQAA